MKKRNKEDKVYFVTESLYIEIYTVGYKNLGESIVFLIKCDLKVVFSAVIDSYCYKGINKTIEYLKCNNVSTLDYFCWTHPDEDHSKGIKELFDLYVDNKTIVNIPKDYEISRDKCSSSVIEIFDFLKEKMLDIDNYNIYNVCDVQDVLAYNNDLKIIKGTKSYDLNITSIAPNSKCIRKDIFENKFNKNDHSIALCIQFDKLKIIFGGDIENPTINRMNSKMIPKRCNYLKIPHHGSKGSDSLIDFIDDIDVACATTYKRGVSNLPDISVIEKYKNISTKLFLTSRLLEKNELNFGVVYTRFDLLNFDNYKNKYFIETYGNAGEYI